MIVRAYRLHERSFFDSVVEMESCDNSMINKGCVSGKFASANAGIQSVAGFCKFSMNWRAI